MKNNTACATDLIFCWGNDGNSQALACLMNISHVFFLLFFNKLTQVYNALWWFPLSLLFFLPSLSLSTLPPLYKSFPHVHYVLFCFGHTEFKQDHLNMGTELPNGVLWTHEWLHNGRQCHFFIQNPLVKNQFRVWDLTIPASIHYWLGQAKPCRSPVSAKRSCCEVVIGTTVSCSTESISNLVTYVPARIFLRPFLLWYEQFFLFNFILKL